MKIINIPVKIKSGSKYKSQYGYFAIKDGIKNTRKINKFLMKKPLWLKTSKVDFKSKYFQIKSLVSSHNLSTVCEESKCPNINECWSHGVATVMLMGSTCSRACKFCAVDTGNPHGWLDKNEPENTARLAQFMQLKYIVITSVTRDDLLDGGSRHFAQTVKTLKTSIKDIKVEVLIPDFLGDLNAVNTVIKSGVDVLAHNIETVKRLTNAVRDNRASYSQSIKILKHAKIMKPTMLTKTSLMLGLGEQHQEVLKAMDDLRSAGVDILTLGQYIQPTKYHFPIASFITPKEFSIYKEIALNKGFLDVSSGPMVRSSYRADRLFRNVK